MGVLARVWGGCDFGILGLSRDGAKFIYKRHSAIRRRRRRRQFRRTRPWRQWWWRRLYIFADQSERNDSKRRQNLDR